MYNPKEIPKVVNYANVVGEENILRVYPYEMVNVNHSETFIKPNAATVVYMTNDFDKHLENQSMELDENGVHYFNVWFDPSVVTVLDSASHTSVYGQEIKEERSFAVSSNWMYERTNDIIKTGVGTTMIPALFTVGRPFNHIDFMNGEQDVFYTPEITTIKEQYEGDLDVSDPEGDYEFLLVNIKNLEAAADNFRILPQTQFNFADLSAADKVALNETSGFSIGLENHTLFGGLKVRGKEAGITAPVSFRVGVLAQATDSLPDQSNPLNHITGLYIEKHTIDDLETQGLAGKDTIFKFSFTYYHLEPGQVIGENRTAELSWKYNKNDLVEAFGSPLITYYDIVPLSKIVKDNSYTLTAAEYSLVSELESEVGSLDLHTKEPLMPFKMTPIENDDKMELFADWFDYDVVMPYFMAKLFEAGAKLDVAITNVDDRKLVLDMLTYSAAFADSFSKVPLNTENKIDPSWKIGSVNTSVANIVGQDPIKIVDGLFESHIRKHPGFKRDRERQQRVKAILCALSRYIYSTYAIGKGQNNFNNAYLPWFLEPIASDLGKIDYTNAVSGSHIVADTVQFQTQSIYFNKNFTSSKVNQPTNKIELPTIVNTSKLITVQTDRKLTLPVIPEVMGIMDKLPLPGDIDTNSSADLSYLWWLPIKTEATMQNIMLNSSKTVSRPSGTELSLTIQNTSPGHLMTDLEIKEALNAQVPSTVIGNINEYVTVVTENAGLAQYIRVWSAGDGPQFPNHYVIGYRGREFQIVDNGSSFEDQFAKGMGYSDGSVVLPNHNFDKMRAGEYFSVQLKYQEFAPFRVTTLYPTNVTLSYEDREATFDKETWRVFLKDMGIVETSKTIHHFLPIKKTYITNVYELEFKSMWGNYVDIYYDPKQTNSFIRVPLFNKDDETITKQRIILT